MYLEHYGLSEAPFRITPHTDFFFAGANRGATLEALMYAITHDEGIVKISGEVGSGKTMLCRVLMERLPETVVIVYLANPSLSRDDILYALADELGIVVPEQSRSGAVMRALQENLVSLHAEGRQVVVLIDEAHAMPMETLEEIRLLSNLETNRNKLLQLVLFGQPELNETLLRSDMRQLRERITHNFSLEPLSTDEISHYLDFRMRAAGYRGPNVFSPAAIKLIAQASQGLTRRVNILADKALLAAFSEGRHEVGSKEAQAAIRDSEFVAPGSQKKAFAPVLWALGGAIGTLAAVTLWQLLAPHGDAPSTAMAIPAEPATTATVAAPATAAVAVPPAPTFPAEPAAAPAPPPVPAAPESAAADRPAPVAPEPAPATSVVAPPSEFPELMRALRDGEAWIASADDRRWFLQLYSSTDIDRPDLVEKYLLKVLQAGLTAPDLRAYRAETGELRRYGIIYGDYDSRKEAVNALNRIPDELKRTRPFPRQAIRLKPENNKE